MSKPGQTRRSFIAAAAAGTVLASRPAAALAPPASDALSDPDNLLSLYKAMRGGAGNGLALWWLTGTLFAKLIGETNVPLVQVHGASWNRIGFREDGNLDQAMEEVGYFADLNDGEILETWTNPINGHQGKPEPYKTLSRQIITPTAVEVSGSPIKVRGQMRPAIVSGDTIWVSEIFSATVPGSMTGGEPRIIESMATFQAQVADVDLTTERFVPATLFFQEIDPFYDWMGMPEDAAGLLIWQVVGRKLRGVDELPAVLAQRIQADHPDFLRNPQV
jgi:hypothetical protein